LTVEQIVNGIANYEFERKFYVAEGTEIPCQGRSAVVQAYLYIGREFSVRIRMTGDEEDVNVMKDLRREELADYCARIGGDVAGLITVKAVDDPHMGIRYEREWVLDPEVCRQLLSEKAEMNPGSVIAKIRNSYVEQDGDKDWAWEIDTFLLDNYPLVIAECENEGPVENLLIPSFCLTEVTGDIRFTNAYLADNPFSRWGGDWKQEVDEQGVHFIDKFGENRFT
jgi:adenylate cyclase